jgi:hypothetical protein
VVNLEQRIQALEREVQLLKGQIQVTLLEIQEQLLKQAYPSLSGGDIASNSTVTVAAVPPTQANSTAMVPVTRVRQFTLNDDDGADSMGDIQVKPVAINNGNSNGNGRRQRAGLIDPDDSEYGSAQRLSLNDSSNAGRDWIELEQWVTQKVDKLGAQRTRNLIDLYTEQERLTRKERALLLEFLYVYVDDPDRTIPSRAQLPDLRTKSGVSIPSPVPSIVPQTRAVVDEIRAELRAKKGETVTEADGQGNGAVNGKQRLVLRLIAGILNAGDSASTENER